MTIELIWVYFWEIQVFYDPGHDGPRLASNDEGDARLTRYTAAGIEETGLGLSDFGVLEVLLHKGPLPVNTIGPIVDLTPGSISFRRRIVALTPHSKDLIALAFRKHSGQMKRVFSELIPEELPGLEVKLKKVGKRAAALTEES